MPARARAEGKQEAVAKPCFALSYGPCSAMRDQIRSPKRRRCCWYSPMEPSVAQLQEVEGDLGSCLLDLSQFGGDQGEESPMEDRGFELDKCSRSKRASLDSIAASRAFSLLSCSISLASCFILRSCAIFR